MEGNIELRYSTDNGSTWNPTNTFYTFAALHLHTFLRQEEKESSSKNAGGKKCVQSDARIIVLTELDTKQFNLNQNTAATANYQYINKLRCAPLINLRLPETDTTEFNSMFNDTGTGTGITVNVHYLTPEDVPDIDFYGGNQTGIKIIRIGLACRDTYTI